MGSGCLKLFCEDELHVNAECPQCGKVLKIKRVFLSPLSYGYRINPYVRCFCGTTFHLIEKPEPSSVAATDKAVHCPRCQSTQLAANKQGFSLGKAAVGYLVIPGGILWGLHGRNKVKITCLKCGHSWLAGKG